jgi:hypothetical protein
MQVKMVCGDLFEYDHLISEGEHHIAEKKDHKHLRPIFKLNSRHSRFIIRGHMVIIRMIHFS